MPVGLRLMLAQVVTASNTRGEWRAAASSWSAVLNNAQLSTHLLLICSSWRGCARMCLTTLRAVCCAAVDRLPRPSPRKWQRRAGLARKSRRLACECVRRVPGPSLQYNVCSLSLIFTIYRQRQPALAPALIVARARCKPYVVCRARSSGRHPRQQQRACKVHHAVRLSSSWQLPRAASRRIWLIRLVSPVLRGFV